MSGRERAVFLISAVSEMLGVHPQTLRLYEREGFIHPLRSEGGVRQFTDEDVERVRAIITLTRDLGVNLAGVEVILSMRERMEGQRAEMERIVEEMRREFMEEMQRREGSPNVKAPGGRTIKVKITKGDG